MDGEEEERRRGEATLPPLVTDWLESLATNLLEVESCIDLGIDFANHRSGVGTQKGERS
jgi:hypothetical protein